MEFKRANKLKAVVLFFFSQKRYHALAVSHSMAVDLEAKDLRAAFEKGTFPSEEQRTKSDENIRWFTSHLHKKLRESFLWVLSACVVALASAYIAGTLSAILEPSISRILVFVGSAFVGWATVFELGGGIATMSGQALHEVIHPVIFKIIFIPGLLLLLTGTVL